MRNYFKNNKGQTLLEAIVVMAILVVILSASATAVITSVNNATFTKNQNIANKYAQEGMEYMRNLKISNYKAFNEFNSTPTGEGVFCLGPAPTYFPTTESTVCDTPNLDEGSAKFIREVKIIKTDSSADTIDCPNCGKSAFPGDAADACATNPNNCAPCSARAKNTTTGVVEEFYGKQVIVRTKWSSGKCPSSNLYCHEVKLESCFMQL